MPCRFVIDPVLHLTTVECSGAVTGPDLLMMQARLLADPAFDPQMRQLCDFRHADLADVSSDDVKQIAARSIDGMARGRRAIVAAPGFSYGLSRMFSAYAGGDEMTAVFADMRAARNWLGLDVVAGSTQ